MGNPDRLEQAPQQENRRGEDSDDQADGERNGIAAAAVRRMIGNASGKSTTVMIPPHRPQIVTADHRRDP